jgi:hypothetical protein
MLLSGSLIAALCKHQEAGTKCKTRALRGHLSRTKPKPVGLGGSGIVSGQCHPLPLTTGAHRKASHRTNWTKVDPTYCAGRGHKITALRHPYLTVMLHRY